MSIDRKHKPFDDSKDREFQNVFRFSKKNTEEPITKRLQRSSDPRDSHAIPTYKQVLVALRLFADGNYCRETGDLLKIFKSSAIEIVFWEKSFR